MTARASEGAAPAAAYVIRPGRARELAALREIEAAAGELFRQVGRGDVADDAPPELPVFERARAEGGLFVLDLDGAPVGFARVRAVDGCAHLDELSVHPAHGRRGLGARLVEFVCAWARARGHDAVTLSTFADVPWNGPFYARLGFRALQEHELTPGLLAVREHEAADGLDVKARVLMRRELGS